MIIFGNKHIFHFKAKEEYKRKIKDANVGESEDNISQTAETADNTYKEDKSITSAGRIIFVIVVYECI